LVTAVTLRTFGTSTALPHKEKLGLNFPNATRTMKLQEGQVQTVNANAGDERRNARSACEKQGQLQDDPARCLRRIRAQSSSVRLFCLPYAGGSTRLFRNWVEWCAPEVEVVALELPGHGSLVRSGLITGMDEMVDHLLPVIHSMSDKPFALFGHSMGALISFELSRALSRIGRRGPIHLFASAMRPPHIQGEYTLHNLPDRQFVEALRAMNGTPSEILSDLGLLELFIPVLRADLRLAETYRFAPAPALKHPITVFGGLSDVTVTVQKLADWKKHTRENCSIRVLQGNHFFIHEQAHVLAASILKTLGRVSLPAFTPASISDDSTMATQSSEPTFSVTG
jgi:medium-chain acyl-[acyl-carrier-protein] hydrolase